MSELNLLEVLPAVDPSLLDYQQWVNVGMALKAEGYDCSVWDDWSRSDSRYSPGVCGSKWPSFRQSGVTGGTIVQYAKEQGWRPAQTGHAIGWEDYISTESPSIDTAWVERKPIYEPEEWHPGDELRRYLEALFKPEDFVGYVTTDARMNDKGKWSPSGKGVYYFKAGDLISKLKGCHDEIANVVGDYHPEAGAWIRFNPLDGQGVSNSNVTEFRYALVESDDDALDKQRGIIEDLQLPVAAMVYSGGKSIHAIVHIDAPNYDEYRSRVDYLYKVLEDNEAKVDTQNKNPSRLSRMPGVLRGTQKQYLIATNIGKRNWDEWKEYYEGIDDGLPDIEHVLNKDLPELSPELIQGVLRQGHKMLIAGPSKAGKTFLLMELAISIAHGLDWMGFQCKQGKVLYINLEIDRSSCFDRFKSIGDCMGIEDLNEDNLWIWNLRGKALPLDKLAPKLIRKTQNEGFSAIIVDPIYKVITGDENTASDMAAFCNLFDSIATACNCSMIYCHHHSKGAQGSKKAMDRSSGSGVFARDPDAVLDIIELPLSDETSSSISIVDIDGEIPDDATAWRMEGTLREFPSFEPVNSFFVWPVHLLDTTGALKDLKPTSTADNLKKSGKRANTPEARKTAFDEAYDALEESGTQPTVDALMEVLSLSKSAIYGRLKNDLEGRYVNNGGFVYRVFQKG